MIQKQMNNMIKYFLQHYDKYILPYLLGTWMHNEYNENKLLVYDWFHSFVSRNTINNIFPFQRVMNSEYNENELLLYDWFHSFIIIYKKKPNSS